ncbi:MAG: hypothetical protein QOD60_2005 [Solirubrobacterales bacterium]|jgi:hypothetical protein|nr:hypothetical protein [Solirubrobacterales bacterium]
MGAAIACAALACALFSPAVGQAAPTAQAQAAAAGPMGGNGMWIWYVSRSSGGNVDAIAARAKLSGIKTVFIKSGDASHVWTQFNPALVAALHARGLRVCAWQFIYGTAPLAEADVGAASVAAGADCLVLDVEGQYEGKYSSADRFMTSLRSKIGNAYPVGLASFPYVDYHPGLPYSVFLNPGNGAQVNLPQMYWKAIGTSITTVFSHTFQMNGVYGRPIAPLGQTYMAPKPKQLRKFRGWSARYGGVGVSWWSWQETARKSWKALRARPILPRQIQPPVLYPTLKSGSKGDLVVWAQEHLVGAGFAVPVTGTYASITASYVRSFQATRGLPQTGIIDAVTWPSLLSVAPSYVAWGASTRSSLGASAPESATLPSRFEIPARFQQG